MEFRRGTLNILIETSIPPRVSDMSFLCSVSRSKFDCEKRRFSVHHSSELITVCGYLSIKYLNSACKIERHNEGLGGGSVYFNTIVSSVEMKAVRGWNDPKLIETLIEITGSARN